jgi:hypothetical protein
MPAVHANVPAVQTGQQLAMAQKTVVNATRLALAERAVNANVSAVIG